MLCSTRTVLTFAPSVSPAIAATSIARALRTSAPLGRLCDRRLPCIARHIIALLLATYPLRITGLAVATSELRSTPGFSVLGTWIAFGNVQLAVASTPAARRGSHINLNHTSTACPTRRAAPLATVIAPALRLHLSAQDAADWSCRELAAPPGAVRELGCSLRRLECTQCIPSRPCRMVALGTASWIPQAPSTRPPSTQQVRDCVFCFPSPSPRWVHNPIAKPSQDDTSTSSRICYIRREHTLYTSD